jgi:ergothioneine biosynthesis protein EgtB
MVAAAHPTTASESLAERYRRIRAYSRQLCEGLEVEDTVVQTMPDVSPTKWHLGHTTWAFETFVLKAFADDHKPFVDAYAVLFNSYYNGVGPQWDRPRRGVLARPTLREVWAYRDAVDAQMNALLTSARADDDDVRGAVEIALQHEQQHQELMLTDLKHVLASNPLAPVYRDATRAPAQHPIVMEPVALPGGLVEIGAAGDGFSYDNERPRHRTFLEDFKLAPDLVTAGDYRAFIDAGGYDRPELWLDDGWQWVRQSGTRAPLYWTLDAGQWFETRLTGKQPVDDDAPVCHVSFYEADAYARFVGARLPTEAEWEHASRVVALGPEHGTFADEGFVHPQGRTAPLGAGQVRDLFGEVWEWTQSAYHPYPRFVPYEGSLAEYNGKFMNNQRVLRGGSVATHRDHIRPSYRNFFQPEKRWQFCGFRLAWDG